MPPLFLYGQTIKPIELHMHGSYRLIVFQLYPFVLKSFFNVKAADINDNCYDLQQSDHISQIIQPLLKNAGFENRIKIISKVLLDIFNNKKAELDFMVRDAIQFILDRNTQVSITGCASGYTLPKGLLNVGSLKKQASRQNNLSGYSVFSNHTWPIKCKGFQEADRCGIC